MQEEEFAQLGALSAQLDSQSSFGRKAAMRAECRKAFVHIDCSRRVREAVVHKAKPISGPYSVGDMVMFRREQGADKPGDEWRGPARILGIDRSEGLKRELCGYNMKQEPLQAQPICSGLLQHLSFMPGA